MGCGIPLLFYLVSSCAQFARYCRIGPPNTRLHDIFAKMCRPLLVAASMGRERKLLALVFSCRRYSTRTTAMKPPAVVQRVRPVFWPRSVNKFIRDVLSGIHLQPSPSAGEDMCVIFSSFLFSRQHERWGDEDQYLMRQNQ